ncbi:hypothetical protein IWQ62_002834 [Dispira parvispora]|uniref:Uncharacterized protein n=1 Tax=Dispira parvispora TaxID=1520584 RepID=A0A9W8AS10_9FUNG|nr:hypothetical protein IWQ62_002834 [Dispira parvispora]
MPRSKNNDNNNSPDHSPPSHIQGVPMAIPAPAQRRASIHALTGLTSICTSRSPGVDTTQRPPFSAQPGSVTAGEDFPMGFSGSMSPTIPTHLSSAHVNLTPSSIGGGGVPPSPTATRQPPFSSGFPLPFRRPSHPVIPEVGTSPPTGSGMFSNSPPLSSSAGFSPPSEAGGGVPIPSRPSYHRSYSVSAGPFDQSASGGDSTGSYPSIGPMNYRYSGPSPHQTVDQHHPFPLAASYHPTNRTGKFPLSSAEVPPAPTPPNSYVNTSTSFQGNQENAGYKSSVPADGSKPRVNRLRRSTTHPARPDSPMGNMILSGQFLD